MDSDPDESAPRLDAMQEFIDWAKAEWGPPTPEEWERAAEIWSNR